MREITAYVSADGQVWTDEAKAVARDTDYLGETLDGFLRHFELGLTRAQEYKALLTAMNKREKLLADARLIVKILEHTDHREDWQ